jgi:hypothetical protein
MVFKNSYGFKIIIVFPLAKALLLEHWIIAPSKGVLVFHIVSCTPIWGLVGMVMWIWKQYQDDMPLHTCVPYWGVLRTYFRLMWMLGIPTMWTWS